MKEQAQESDVQEKISAFAAEKRAQFEDLLGRFVEIPTVSADPGRAKEFQRAVKFASEVLRSFGATVTVHSTPGNPVIVGELVDPQAKKTLTIYNHLDVQPAQEPEWKQDPFVFVNENGTYRGRGSTDDKGPALTALFASAFARQEGIPLNIRFLWEMEEEIGSPHFEQFVRAHKRSLKSDFVFVVDSVWLAPDKPTIYYSLRGNIAGSMFLETATKDAHSGVTGGIARNPMAELMDVAGKLHDARSGRVKIPGFYKSVRPLDPAEMRNIRRLGFDLKGWAKAFGLKRIRVADPMDALIRAWFRPTFEVHGMVGGYTGAGVKTAIPPRAELKFSTRLVPDQDPEAIAQLIVQRVKQCNPDVRVQIHAKLQPYLGAFSGTCTDAAKDALQFGFGKKPVLARGGGSDGAVAIMQKHLKAPITLLGLSLPAHGYHAPNEYFDWGQALGGMKTFARLFANLAAL
jgi:acetylornithine deacetylase/succinyl-diaminopimelate desuccinylase-like protein